MPVIDASKVSCTNQHLQNKHFICNTYLPGTVRHEPQLIAAYLKRKIYPLTIDNNTMCSWVDFRQAQAQNVGAPKNTIRCREGDMNLPELAWATQIKDFYSKLWARVCWVSDRQGKSLRGIQGPCEVVEFVFKELAQGLRSHDAIEPVILSWKLNVRCVCSMNCDLLIHQPRMESWNIIVDASMLLQDINTLYVV
jgi:hypothetical protein